MNRKTIHATLSKKMNDWLDTLPMELRNQIKPDIIVTGGCIASLLQSEKPNDYDIYFRSKASVLALARFYKDQRPDLPIEIIDGADYPDITIETVGYRYRNLTPDRVKLYVGSQGIEGETANEITEEDIKDLLTMDPPTEENEEKKKYVPQFFTSNAISLSGNIQLVLRFHGIPEEIHKNFDFVHCTNWWTFEDKLQTNTEALEAILTKQLKYIGSRYPLSSIIRTKKFIQRGYRINAGTYLKILFQVSNLKLDDINVLEEQLTGVDVAYFTAMIDALRSKADKDSKEGKQFTINYEYISEIINRFFE